MPEASTAANARLRFCRLVAVKYFTRHRTDRCDSRHRDSRTVLHVFRWGSVAEDGRRRERIFSVLFVCVCVRGGEILMRGWHSVFASLLVISKFSFVAPVAE